MNDTVAVLREAGEPLDLREITRRVSQRRGWGLMYDDVHGVLAAAEERGEVERVEETRDFREDLWRAT